MRYLVSLLFVLLMVSQSYADVVFTDDFESGNLNKWTENGGCWPHSFNIVNDPVLGSANKVLRIRNVVGQDTSACPEGSPWRTQRTDPNGNLFWVHRTELKPTANIANPVNEGDEVWWGGRIYIPTNYPVGWASDNDRTVVILNTIPPPFDGGDFQNDISGNGTLRNRVRTATSRQYSITNLGPIVKGKWLNYVFHYRRSTSSSGIAQVWIDDVLVVNYTGRTSQSTQTAGVWKNGLYIGFNILPLLPVGTVFDMYWDEQKIATGPNQYDNVVPTPVHPLVGRVVEPIHNTTTDPTGTIIAAAGCESVIESAAPGSVFLIDEGTCTTSNSFFLSGKTLYPHNGALVTLSGVASNVIDIGSNVTVAGITVDGANATRCMTINGNNVTLRSNNIRGGRGGDCVRIEGGDGITVKWNRINGGGGPDSSNGHTLHCRGTGTSTTPTNISIFGNELYKDAGEIGWTNWGSGTEDLYQQRNCGAVTVTQNWFRGQVSNGEEFVDLKETRDGFTQTFSYNFLDCRTLASAKDAMILQVESDHESNASTNTTDIYGNVFYRCDQGVAHGALTYAASDEKPNQMVGDLYHNLFIADGDTDPILQIRELTTATIVHNTLVNGGLNFNTGAGSEPENQFDLYAYNIHNSLGAISNTQFNATSCVGNNIFGSTGSLSGSCTATNTLSPVFAGSCSGTTLDLNCTPTGPSFLLQPGADGFAQGALVPPRIESAEIGAVSPTTLVVNMAAYHSTLAHDGRPVKGVQLSNVGVFYDNAPVVVSGSDIPSSEQIRLTMAEPVAPGVAVRIATSTGWCTDSSNLGHASDIIGHEINALCATENFTVTNSLATLPPRLHLEGLSIIGGEVR